jgi:hypothetical protein
MCFNFGNNRLGKVWGDFLQAHLVTLLAAHKAFFLSQGFSQS